MLRWLTKSTLTKRIELVSKETVNLSFLEDHKSCQEVIKYTKLSGVTKDEDIGLLKTDV